MNMEAIKEDIGYIKAHFFVHPEDAVKRWASEECMHQSVLAVIISLYVVRLSGSNRSRELVEVS